MTKIAIQGEAASFHDIAASKFFNGSTRIYCDTFYDTFKSLVDGEADYALIAIENSLYGSINEVYDLLRKQEVNIIGETYLRIEQCLIGLPDTDLSAVTDVFSHPVALAQCDEFLDTYLPHVNRNEHSDTAGSVEFIKDQNNKSFVAIAGREAAKHYGMSVLRNSIETNKENYTRFMVISKNSTEPIRGKANKTSMILTTSDEPGALYDALGTFAKRNINLSKLQSRPIIGKAWHYMFYIDAKAPAGGEDLKQTIKELKAQGCDVNILGSYPAGDLPDINN
jgi:prephenate dehydratase